MRGELCWNWLGPEEAVPTLLWVRLPLPFDILLLFDMSNVLRGQMDVPGAGERHNFCCFVSLSVLKPKEKNDEDP